MTDRKGPGIGIQAQKPNYRRVTVTLWDDGNWQVARDNCYPIDLFAMSQLLDFQARLMLTTAVMEQNQARMAREALTRRIVTPGSLPPQ